MNDKQLINKEHILRYACRRGNISLVDKLLSLDVNPCVKYCNTTCLELVIDKINIHGNKHYVYILENLINRQWSEKISSSHIYYGLKIAVEFNNQQILKFFTNLIYMMKSHKIVWIVIKAIKQNMNNKIIGQLIDYIITLNDVGLTHYNIFKVILMLPTTMNTHKDKCLKYLYNISTQCELVYQRGLWTIKYHQPSLRTVEIINVLLCPGNSSRNLFIKLYLQKYDKLILQHILQHLDYYNVVNMIMKLPLKENSLEISKILSKKYGAFILLYDSYNLDVIIIILRRLFNIIYQSNIDALNVYYFNKKTRQYNKLGCRSMHK